MAKPDINDAIERNDDHHNERHNHFMEIKKTKKIDLLFIGDSITRRWSENPELWDLYFAEYNPENFGVGGDTIQNVRWRLLNGEIDDIEPKIVVLLVGTNNLPIYSAKEIYAGITQLIDIIQRKLPHTLIILMGLLPRDADNLCNNYMNTILEINSILLNLSLSRKITFLDIGEEYIDKNNKVNRELLPDGIHITRPGYKIWGKKLQPIIDDLYKNL
ncbi:MAG: GDSL-type esterase/lipase family protein [Bacillota bacterium]